MDTWTPLVGAWGAGRLVIPDGEAGAPPAFCEDSKLVGDTV
jgi:hypothetical protein